MRLASDLRAAVLQAAMQGDLCERTNKDAHELLFQIKCDKQSSSARKDKRLFPDETAPDKKYYYVIPSNWVWTKIGAILSKLTDGTHKTPKYVSNGLKNAVKFVSVKDMSGGHLDLTNTKYISQEEHEELYKRCDPKPNDVLLSKVGTTGVPAIVDTDEQFSLFVSVALMRFDTTKILPRFLYWLIYSPIVQQQAVDNTRGVGNQNWVLDKIANTWIPIPPVEEQALIVDRIDELMPVVNEYEEMENRLVALKGAFPGNFREAILFSAIQGKLTQQHHSDEPVAIQTKRLADCKAASGALSKKDNLPMFQPTFDIPEGWTWTTLSRLGTLSGGKTPSMHDAENWSSSDVNWFTSKDMKQKYLSESMMKISLKASEELQLFPSGTLLMVVRSGILKHTLPLCILTNEATINQDLKAFTLFDSEMSEYVYWMLKGLQPEIIMRYTKHVTTVDSLRMDEFFYQMPVPLPPIEEQQRIVDRLNTILPMCDELVDVI